MSAGHPQCVSEAELRHTVAKIVAVYELQAESVKNHNPAVPEARVPRVLVAVAGRPGSGKSTAATVLADAVRKALCRHPDPLASYRAADIHDAERAEVEGNPRDVYYNIGERRDIARGVEVCVMPMDGYHLYRKELSEMPDPQEAVRRRGAEWTFNPVKLQRDLKAMKRFNERGLFEDVLVPSFDHGAGDPVERDIRIPGTAGVVIVEGNYLLYRGTPAWAKVANRFDVKIFLACDKEVCTKRLARRHMKAWKISMEKAMERAAGSDTVNGDLVDTTQKNADVVLHSIEVPQSKL
ncbi:hypothetical protein ABB37_07182 [Leptomonas pyrrhocoris]|uniref:Phosphoribulokinase/uridine kinase domain-containing protein n=1 Tax=Leptomonas pyrrhocoris TaxID=157538 RepID=A0A0N0DTD1_LEPPY|nr:hypothetical protein ABB37_07182 [Leptomonas pyrrhocoris]KPA77291.1 hypothetical protein ABB37_07182 [Leptomonas pyrrhocoris]|eukprot:XP_015655730.1 hypothetical protein ABB37_07182 [Leptomonas pyrrhocoris]